MGFLSRRFELEADLESLELLGDPAPLASALAAVTGAHAFRRSSWRHFSSAERVSFLARVQGNPELGRALRRRVRALALLGAGLLGVAALLQAQDMGERWSSERLFADLRLGRYAEARARGEALLRIDARVEEGEEATGMRLEHLVHLARVGDELADPDHTATALEEAALRALERGADERALDLAELAYLRGRRELAAVLRHLAAVLSHMEERLDGPGEGAPVRTREGLDEPSGVPDRWLEALRRRYDPPGY
jgi:hypothetical protein